jgi:hypothetical protein
MQMNVYVPRTHEETVRRLNLLSRRTGRPKSELVMEAIERFLHDTEGDGAAQAPVFKAFDLGRGVSPTRPELYGQRRPN